MTASSPVNKKRSHNHIDAGGDENKMSLSQKSVAVVVHASVPGCKARRTAAKEALKRGAKEHGAYVMEEAWLDAKVLSQVGNLANAQPCGAGKSRAGVREVVVVVGYPQDSPHLAELVVAMGRLASTASGARVQLRLVRESWLVQLVRTGALPPVLGHEVDLPGTAGTLLPAPRRGPEPSLGRYERWLGHWRQEYDAMDDCAIMMQARFNAARCAAVGNAAIACGLRELKQLELAVQTSEDEVGTRALAYARAAAAVQACAFRIAPSMTAAFLAQQLPFVSASIAQCILEMAASAQGHTVQHVPGTAAEAQGTPCGGGSGSGAATGATCQRLELLRADQPVCDGEGMLRPDTAGAASRARLRKLPTVGPVMAKAWYELGCRTLADAAALMEAGQLTPLPGPTSWALRHHQDLTQDVTPQELQEMVEEVGRALCAATQHCSGWQVTPVGGARRGRASHDVDLMLSHPAVREPDDMTRQFGACFAELVRAGRMLPAEGNITRLQEGLAARYVARVEADLRRGVYGEGRRTMHDGHDHVYGVYVTHAGRYKRLDLIFVAAPCLPHALLGWTGSTVFLRLLKDHCNRQARADSQGRGYLTTNHNLYDRKTLRPVTGISTEEDIFRVLGLQYKPPEDRQCP